MTKEERAAAYAKMLYPTMGHPRDIAIDAFVEGVNWNEDKSKPILDELIHMVERIEGAKLVGWLSSEFSTRKAQQLIKDAGREWEKP